MCPHPQSDKRTIKLCTSFLYCPLLQVSVQKLGMSTLFNTKDFFKVSSFKDIFKSKVDEEITESGNLLWPKENSSIPQISSLQRGDEEDIFHLWTLNFPRHPVAT